jgi:hypothetical protein
MVSLIIQHRPDDEAGGVATIASPVPVIAKESKHEDVIATAIVALSLLSSAAQAASPFHGYPDWARAAFETVN